WFADNSVTPVAREPVDRPRHVHAVANQVNELAIGADGIEKTNAAGVKGSLLEHHGLIFSPRRIQQQPVKASARFRRTTIGVDDEAGGADVVEIQGIDGWIDGGPEMVRLE